MKSNFDQALHYLQSARRGEVERLGDAEIDDPCNTIANIDNAIVYVLRAQHDCEPQPEPEATWYPAKLATLPPPSDFDD